MSRVLVVDDKEMMRDSVATTLSRRGYVVVAAPAGDNQAHTLSPPAAATASKPATAGRPWATTWRTNLEM